MIHIQLDFTKVPKQLREATGKEVQKLLPFPDRHNHCLDKNYIVLGYSEQVEWASMPFKVAEYPVYDVLSQWDEWINIVSPRWVNQKIAISQDYRAEVFSDCIKVGCQTISFDAFDKLAKIVQEAKDFAKK